MVEGFGDFRVLQFGIPGIWLLTVYVLGLYGSSRVHVLCFVLYVSLCLCVCVCLGLRL